MEHANDNERGDAPIPYALRHQMAQRLDHCIAELSIITDAEIAGTFERIYLEMKRITLDSITLAERRTRLRPFQAGIGQFLRAAETPDVDRAAGEAQPTLLEVLEKLELQGQDVLRKVRQQRPVRPVEP